MTARYNYDLLLDHIYTKKQATGFLSQLDTLLGVGFNAQGELFKKIEESLSYESAEVFKSCAQANTVDLADPSQFKSFIVELKTYIEKMPIMVMYLAFDAPEKSLKSISQWFVNTLKKRYLLDIVIRREIIGGTVLVINGVFRDYSVKQKIHLLYKDRSFLSENTV